MLLSFFGFYRWQYSILDILNVIGSGMNSHRERNIRGSSEESSERKW
jgi:hypothetical protein